MRYSGASGKANVGISNDKGDAPSPQDQGFPGDVNRPGVSRVLRISLMAKPMA